MNQLIVQFIDNPQRHFDSLVLYYTNLEAAILIRAYPSISHLGLML